MVVHDFLTRSARRWPDKEACITPERRLTYAQFDAEATQFARALVDAGIEKGDRVGVFLENRVEGAIAIFGILRAGGAFVMINPTTKPDKACYILNDCAAKAAVVPMRAKAAIEAIENDVASMRAIFTCGPIPKNASPSGAVPHFDFTTRAAQFPAGPGPVRCIDMDLAAIIYTSGSTGRPKGVIMTHLNVISAATSVSDYLENVPEDIILNVLPLSFDYGLYQLLMTVKIGATLVLERSFAYPYQIVQRIKDEAVTGFPGVPTMYAMLLQMEQLDPAMFDTVRFITNTGAALPVPHIKRLGSLFRNARIYSMYGVTESKRCTYLPPEELERRPASVGRGMPNEEVFVVDDDGNPVAPGEVGELVIRGSNVMQGYWELPEATAEVLRPGRYPWEKVLYTGDLFKTDEEGYLYFVSRKDDIIKSRGEKVSPREVENVICEIPQVQQAAVIGIPDEILGQAVKAFVVLTPGAELNQRDIIGHCTRRLESFMVPKVAEFRDDLPKTSSGKVKHKALGEPDQGKETSCGQ
ncbi:MAG: AMP-binding protein [Nitrospiraceae bacterium]|nr:AMP-binding protein [Nitrospiraceae bacterium]